jgi:hypothetical protein
MFRDGGNQPLHHDILKGGKEPGFGNLALLPQDRVDVAVKRTMMGALGQQSLGGYLDHIYPYISHPMLKSSMPVWLHLNNYSDEFLKLNNQAFWADLISQLGIIHSQSLADLQQGTNNSAVDTLAGYVTDQNSKYYTRALLYTGYAAALGSKFAEVPIDKPLIQKRIGQHEITITPIDASSINNAAVELSNQFPLPPANYGELIERLQTYFPGPSEARPGSYETLVNSNAFHREHYGIDLNCPATGITSKIFRSLGNLFKDEDYIQMLKSRTVNIS